MNETPVFAWKAIGLGPHFQVEVADTAVTIQRNGKPTSIPLSGTERVYLQEVYAPPMSEQLHVELVTGSGKGFDFYGANRGRSTVDLVQCRNAASAMLEKFSVAQPVPSIYMGSRPDKPLRFLVVALVLFALTGLIWLGVYLLCADAQQASAIASVLFVCFLFGTIRTFRRAKSAQEVTPATAVSQLASR